MRLKNCILSPLVALGLGACQLSDKNLGEANPDSAGVTVGSTDGQTSESASPDPETTTAPETTSGTTLAPETTSGTTLEPETTSGTTLALETTSGTTDESGTSDATTIGPDECMDPLDAPGVGKACEVDEDCLLVFHQADCCGSLVAQGIEAGSLEAYNAAEEPCAVGAVCDCLPKPTPAEDGQAGANPRSFGVACVDNQCQSQVIGQGLLVWHETCGDPVCTGHVEQQGIEPCAQIDAAEVGFSCDAEGAVCDLVDACNTRLVCGFKDPKVNGC